MSKIPGYELIGPRRIGALEKDVVIPIACHFKPTLRSHKPTANLCELKQFEARAVAHSQLRPRENRTILLKNRS
jgi:hypothetical protein